MNKEEIKILKQIGARIKEIRESKGQALRDLEAHSGVDYANISKYETGISIPTIPTLIKLAKGLEVEIVEFFK